jgi:CheY-like chemotaxis protein
MGGDITVTSQMGKGSCFRLNVPLEAAEAGHQHKKPTLKRVISLKPGTGPFRILVADDITENRALLLALLGPLGFEVKAATNGDEAIDIFQAWAPHLVLMDMRMPVMDGYEAIRQLKATEKGRAVPVIAVTASAFEDNVKQVMETGADGYLRKPFLPEELFAQLEKCPGLHYVFAEEHDESLTRSQPAQIVTANLPHELLAAMRQAVADGEMAILTELIARVAKLDSETARGLQELADRYEYGELAEWLAKGEKL